MKLRVFLLLMLLMNVACVAHRSQSGPFQSQYDPSLVQPEIQVINQADRDINLALKPAKGGKREEMTIQKNSTRAISVAAGEYQYEATAMGVKGSSGTALFDSQHRYTWTFQIVSSSSR